MTPTVRAFSVATCEDLAKQQKAHSFVPAKDGPLAPFRIGDPFGLRKAIVPLFLRHGTQLVGMGTGFHVDEWGTMLTADHVIDAIRVRRHSNPRKIGGNFVFESEPADPKIYAVLGIGLIYGTVRFPESAVAPIGNAWTPAEDSDDPLAALRGDVDMRVSADISVLKLTVPPHRTMHSTLPLRMTRWHPVIGETVLAVGFPEIESKATSFDPTEYLLSEQMYAPTEESWGHISRGGIWRTQLR